MRIPGAGRVVLSILFLVGGGWRGDGSLLGDGPCRLRYKNFQKNIDNLSTIGLPQHMMSRVPGMAKEKLEGVARKPLCGAILYYFDHRFT